MLNRLRAALTKRAAGSKKLQAELDFEHACGLLDLNEHYVAGVRQPEEAAALYEELRAKWSAPKVDLGKKIAFANDSMTIQLAEMFQHLHDIDSGDVAGPPARPMLTPAERRANAAVRPAIGPSTHTNEVPTLAFHMKAVAEEDAKVADVSIREQLAARLGFSLWIGPSQAPTPDNKAGVYVKGKVAPGTVVGLYPGAVFNGEMLQKAVDCGHLGNPAVPRRFLPRFDEAVIDIDAADAPKTNPFALGQHVRHPPKGILPNVMRLQYDFIGSADGAAPLLPFPVHLRDYIPNVWGSPVSTGQQLYGALEHNIWVKGMALIALRPLWNEELFVDHALNPASGKRPDWYIPLDDAAAGRVWGAITA